MAVEIMSDEFIIDWDIISFELLTTLEDKMMALINGEIIVIRNFEQFTGRDVMVKLVTVKGERVSKISYDTMKSSIDDAFWITYNIGINDLSLLPVMQFYKIEDLQETNKFQVGDVVAYVSEENGKHDTAFITDVYKGDTLNNKGKYLYALSREDNWAYEENELMGVE